MTNLSGVAIAQRCEETLFADGLQAMAACEAKVVTPALENIIELIPFLWYWFESGGLAAAMPSIMALQPLLGTSTIWHTVKKSSLRNASSIVLENRPKEELNKYIRFYQQIGMPTMKEMHLETALWRSSQVGQQATIEGEPSIKCHLKWRLLILPKPS